MPRLIDADKAMERADEVTFMGFRAEERKQHFMDLVSEILKQPTVDTYTEEQVAEIVKMANTLAAKANELEKEVVWLKSCLNCKIRKECPSHCGKVVHNCDHWEYGDNAAEVKHGEWLDKYEIKSFRHTNIPVVQCSKCECYFCDIINNHHYMYHYCPNCGADMRGDGNA